MSVLDEVSPATLADASAAMARDFAGTVTPTGFDENFGAAWDYAWSETQSISREAALHDAWQRRVDAVQAATGERLANPRLALPSVGAGEFGQETDPEATRAAAEAETAAKVAKLRDRFPDLPEATPEAVRAEVRDNARKVRAWLGQTQAGATFLGDVGGVAGGLAAAALDPPNIIAMTLGAPAGVSFLTGALAEAGINAFVEATNQPAVARFKAELGVDYGAGDIAQAIGGAALGGASFYGLARLVSGAVRAALRAGRIADTPETRAALGTVEGAADLAEANPFPKGAAGEAAHDGALAAADQLVRGEVGPRDGLARIEEATAGETPRRTDTAGTVLGGVKEQVTVAPARSASAPAAADNLHGVVFAFKPAELQIDAKLFQFKAGGDTAGVTDRLAGVTEWDPVKAGQILVYEYRDGRRFAADGHQRVGLARRIAENDPGQNVTLYGQVLREADGITPEQARATAAMKNVAEGTGTAIDAAKVLRVDPKRLRELPPQSALVRTARDLVQLSDDAFLMVVNEVVPPHYAAIVGRLAAGKPELQSALMTLLAKTDPSNLVQAEAIVRQGIEAGVATRKEATLFGEETIAESLYVERAKVLDRALKALRQDRRVFDTLARNKQTIEAAGNVLSTDENTRRAVADAQALQTLQALANRRGPVADALNAAARRARDERGYAGAVADFVAAVRSAVERGDLDGLPAGRSGSGVQAANEGGAGAGQADLLGLAATRDPTPELAELGLFPNRTDPAAEPLRELVTGDAGRPIEPARFDPDLERPGERPADQAPVEAAVVTEARRAVAVADFRVDVERPRADGNPEITERTARELLDDADAEAKAAKEVEGCAASVAGNTEGGGNGD
jgi:hypothetical protein